MTDVSQLNYLPLTLPFFSLLAGVLLALVVLIEIGLLRFTADLHGFA